jgi:hypothetical protein
MIKSFFGRHLFFPAFVLPEFVLTVAGTAPRLEYLFAYHRNDRMISSAFAARTMIVDIVAQSHGDLRGNCSAYFAAKRLALRVCD